ncbi:hypothetical protein [Thalassobacillus devorans]|uniref:hypothetical protein n=1 Tax=Thalassobacillus devorans TaxID=279813 RepID=UPI001593E354|nr:hypothetical protein [Thalassobacillus devorans]
MREIYTDSRRTIARISKDNRYERTVEVRKEGRLIAALFTLKAGDDDEQTTS